MPRQTNKAPLLEALRAAFQAAGVPYGYCCCGCGERTEVAKLTNSLRGHVQGEPRRFRHGHSRVGKFKVYEDPGPNPGGLCMCGCGLPAPLADATRVKRGWIKGKPIQYIQHHHPGHVHDPFSPENYEIIGECWVWRGRLYKEGYGVVNGDAAHRRYYERFIGAIPKGLIVHHECENKACVNPGHLRALTQGEHSRVHNLSRRSVEARRRRALTSQA